jgi:hypothetical protein
MKKIVSILLMTGMFAVIPWMPAPVMAAPSVCSVTGEARPCPRGTFRVRRNTRTKKKLVNALIAGGVGAAIGGGIGGKRGALVGLGGGSGGYLLYRYVRDRRGRCVARRV